MTVDPRHPRYTIKLVPRCEGDPFGRYVVWNCPPLPNVGDEIELVPKADNDEARAEVERLRGQLAAKEGWQRTAMEARAEVERLRVEVEYWRDYTKAKVDPAPESNTLLRLAQHVERIRQERDEARSLLAVCREDRDRVGEQADVALAQRDAVLAQRDEAHAEVERLRAACNATDKLPVEPGEYVVMLEDDMADAQVGRVAEVTSEGVWIVDRDSPSERYGPFQPNELGKITPAGP